MSFDVSTITTSGATLIAAATAANKLILVGCDATTQVLTQAQAIAVTSRPSSPFSTSTRVFLEGSDANHVYCRVQFVAGESTGGDVNTLYLYGHSETDPTNDIVLAVLSSATAFHLPESGDVTNTYGVLFDIVYTAESGAIETINSSAFATYAEFNRLKERTVTTHKDGDLSSGDNQTILGTKTFSDWTNLYKSFGTDERWGVKAADFGWLPSNAQHSAYRRIGLLRTDSLSDPTQISAWENCIEVSGFERDLSDPDSANNYVYIKSNNANGTSAYIVVANGDSEPYINMRTDWTSEGITYSSYILNNINGIEIGVKNTDLSNSFAILYIDYQSSGYDMAAILPDENHAWQIGEDGKEFARGHFADLFVVDTLSVHNNDNDAEIQADIVNAKKITSSTGSMKIQIDNTLLNTTMYEQFNSDWDNAGTEKLTYLSQTQSNVTCSATDAINVANSVSNASTVLNYGSTYLSSVKQMVTSSYASFTVNTSATNNSVNRGYLQVTNQEVNLAVTGSTTDVFSHIQLTTTQVLFGVYKSSSVYADLAMQFVETTGAGSVFKLIPSTSSSTYVDLGSSTNKFRSVYAQNFIGDLNGTDDYFNFAIAFGAGTGSSATKYGMSLSDPQSSNFTIIDFREIIPDILAGNTATGDTSNATIGQIALCKFKLTVAGETPVYNPGTIYDSSSTSTGMSSKGTLSYLRMICSGQTDEILDSQSLNTLSGKWQILNQVAFDSGAAQNDWAIVLAVKISN